MCGIFGAVNGGDVVDALLAGLNRLQYRGYDSAGVAVMGERAIVRRRAKGKLLKLQATLAEAPIKGRLGIAHTRWATHGGPTLSNAHPQATPKVAVVHNGIIENHGVIRTRLQADGFRFESETDTEVVPALVTQNLERGMTAFSAVHSAVSELRGSYALAFLINDEEERLILARQGSPLIIGQTEDAAYVSSDALAINNMAGHHLHLEDGDIAEVTATRCAVYDRGGRRVQRNLELSEPLTGDTGKGGFAHHMLKEIHQQPDIIESRLSHHRTTKKPENEQLCYGVDQESFERVCLIACGTSYYAGLVAQQWFESIAGLPAQVHVASEFRYRDIPLDPRTLCVFISQSGETADTLAAMEKIRSLGLKSLAVVNVGQSSMARLADAVLLTHAGPEIGVASTKAFTAQLLEILDFVVNAARSRGRLSEDQSAALDRSLSQVPILMRSVLSSQSSLQPMVKVIATADHVLYLGRGLGQPLALEGALKLKEISYIHAEAYPAGELKHGPLALVDASLPVLIIAPNDELFGKTMSTVREVAARGGRVLLITDAPVCEIPHDSVELLLRTPTVHPWLVPLLYAIPLQLIAYRVALQLERDIDQPRNLAKSVTVE